MALLRRVLGRIVLLVFAVAIAVAAAIVLSPDPLSAAGRAAIEHGLDRYLDRMRQRAARGAMTTTDRVVLHSGIIAGIGLGYVIYPEAAAVLRHAAYGDGSTLVLSPDYFRRSPYIRRQVARRGTGKHGPIRFPQQEDMRTSLALMPIYLDITPDSVRISHPYVMFAAADSVPVTARVLIGRLNLRIYDNLVGAIQRHPFEAYAIWARDDREATARAD